MRWFKLTVAYDGSAFHGWQTQIHEPTVQRRLEDALRRATSQQVRVTASGRTDAGVHALGQVVSCAVDTDLAPETLLRALNANLTPDIRVVRAAEVPEGFDAITHSISKTYRYWLNDGRIPDLFWRHHAWYIPQVLDDRAMHCAAQKLVGRHDFRAYQSAGSPRKTTVRTVTRLDVERVLVGETELVRLEVTADGFLYNMVRNLVGTLARVGQGREAVDWPAEVLAGGDRRRAGPTAPPQGLFLVSVDYPAPWLG